VKDSYSQANTGNNMTWCFSII